MEKVIQNYIFAVNNIEKLKHCNYFNKYFVKIFTLLHTVGYEHSEMQCKVLNRAEKEFFLLSYFYKNIYALYTVM